MHLRSGAYYRSGHQIEIEARSLATTQESTERTHSLREPLEEEVVSETDSISTMASTSTQNTNLGVELEYDFQIRYEKENLNRAKIYRDQNGQFMVKVEDHHTEFDPAPWVNYQGDRYMGKDGAMYLIIVNPKTVDFLGNEVPEEDPLTIEGPPVITPTGYKLVNSIWTHRVPIDDYTRAVYKREDAGT